jgi:tetratricopeptide (TPR) repeat protein
LKRVLNIFIILIIVAAVLPFSAANAQETRQTKRIIVLPYNIAKPEANDWMKQLLPDRMSLFFNHTDSFVSIDSSEWARVVNGGIDYKKLGNLVFKGFSGLHADYVLFGTITGNGVTFYLYSSSDGMIRQKEIRTDHPESFDTIVSLIDWLKNEVGGDFSRLDTSPENFSVMRYGSLKAVESYMKMIYDTKDLQARGENPKAALKMLEAMIKEDPEFLSLRDIYASALFQMEKSKEAKTEYEHILKLNPKFIPAIIGIAMIYDKEGQPDKSAEFILRQAGSDMKPLLLYNYALFLGKSGQTGKSQETYEQLLQMDPYYKPARVNLASLLFSLNNYDEALEIYDGLKRDYPDDLMNEYTIASIYMRQNEFEKAKGILLELAQKGKFKEVYNDLGIIARKEEEYEQSEYFLKKAIQVDAGYYPAYNNLGILYSITGKNEQAVQSFNEALKINPSNADALYNLGILCFKSGDLNRAWVYFSRASTISPGFTRAKLNLAVIEMKRGNTDAAEKILKKCASETPSDALIQYNLGVLYRSTGKYQQAMTAFRQALFSSPDMADAANNIGAILLRQKKYEEAAEWIDKALALSQDDPVYLFNRGLAEYYQENYDRAADYFLNTLLKDKDSARVNQFLISSLLEDGRYEEAEKHIEYMRKTYPANLEFEYLQAVFLERTGRDNQAVQTLEKLIEKGYMTDAVRNLGMLYAKLQMYDKAVKLFNELISLDGKDTRSLMELGKLYLAQNKTSEAEKTFSSVVSLDSKNKKAYIYLGNIYIKENDMKKAEALYSGASVLFPDETDFIYNHSLTCLYLGENEKALALMQSAVGKMPENADYHYSLAFIYKKMNDKPNMLVELKKAFELNSLLKNEFLKDEDFKEFRSDRDVLKILGD